MKPFTLLADADLLKWRKITNSSWRAPGPVVLVHIGLIGEETGKLDALGVDDLTMSCASP